MLKKWAFIVAAAWLLWPLLLRPAQAAVLQLTYAEVRAPQGHWQLVVLPDDWGQTRPDFGGSLRYRVVFDAQGLFSPLDVPALYVPRVCSNVAVTLNGTAVGSGGRMELPYTRNCFVPQLFTLPLPLLKPEGNVLELEVVGYPLRHVSASQRSSGLSDLLLGPLHEVKPEHDRAMWWAQTLPKIITAVLGLFTLFIVALWLARPQETYFGYFALWSGWWTLNTSRLFLTDLPLPGPLIEMLTPATVSVCVTGIVLFFMRFLGRSVRWVNQLLWWQIPGVFAVFVLAGWDHIHTLATGLYGLWFIPQFLAVLVWFLWTSWHVSRRDFWLFLVILGAILVIVVIEMAATLLLIPLKVHIAHLGGPITLLPVGLRLIWVFTESMRRTERLNQELEDRVTEKTREIERSYAELSDLRTREAAQRERQRIASDLHDDLGAKLLTIAQTAHAQPANAERVSTLARQALDDMRLSVRGIVGEAALASDVLADWRAETVARLSEAGISPEWVADDPPAGLVLPARTHVQLTRVLREAVSNTIRHSGATRCRVCIALQGQILSLQVDDDGKGLPTETRTLGQGLPSMERRARKLGGRHRFERSDMGGLRVGVVVPWMTPGAQGELGASGSPIQEREVS